MLLSALNGGKCVHETMAQLLRVKADIPPVDHDPYFVAAYWREADCKERASEHLYRGTNPMTH